MSCSKNISALFLEHPSQPPLSQSAEPPQYLDPLSHNILIMLSLHNHLVLNTYRGDLPLRRAHGSMRSAFSVSARQPRPYESSGIMRETAGYVIRRRRRLLAYVLYIEPAGSDSSD